jgi:heptosyltransferase-2
VAEKEKILVVGPAWVGDMVMAQSLFKLLAEQNPGVTIDVIAPAWSEPLLARMTEVRRAVSLPVEHGRFGFRERWRIGRNLRAENYDRAIILQRSLKSALVPFLAGVRWRTGYRGEMRYGFLNDVRRLDRTKLDQTVKRYIALGLPEKSSLPEPPNPCLQINPVNANRLIGKLKLSVGKNPVALMPGAAYGAAKCWPIKYFGQLAAGLSAAGREVWVLGSASEQSVGEVIRHAGGISVHNLCGRTSLEDSIDLLSLAHVAVTNDSGLMHVAAAAGCHVVAIYGSTSPGFTPPLTERRTIHYLGLDCSPCFQRECPLGHLACLRDILPAKVLENVLETG